jgi:hypothetical protein
LENYVTHGSVTMENLSEIRTLLVGGTAIINLYGTKTDNDKKGVTKFFCNLKGQFPNPFKMIFILKSIKRSSSGKTDAFFATADGKAITRPMFVKFLQEKLFMIFPNININEWNGISLRKGGATSAMRAGVRGEIIQTLGGWTTDIYKGYLDHSLVDVSKAQQQIAATTMLQH